MRPKPTLPLPSTGPAGPAGFTLIELMIVIVIVGIMVMTVAPSLQQLLGDNRQSNAAADLVRIGRLARASAISTGAAHMLRFTESGPAGSNLGLIELYAGMNNKCQQTPWAQAIAAGPVAVFDMTEWNPASGAAQPTAADTGRQVITLRAQTITNAGTPTARTALRVCFQPNGDVYTTSADAATQLVMQRDRVRFSIARTITGVSYGRVRQVLFPAAGSARFE